jgi:hypothetical protein
VLLGLNERTVGEQRCAARRIDVADTSNNRIRIALIGISGSI